MAKILFAHPLFLSKSPAEQASASPYFPLGLLYLAAYVRERGHDVAIFDGTFEDDESAFARVLVSEAPDVVGISALLPTRAVALDLAALAAARDVVVVVGGPDATSDPMAYLSSQSVDVVVHHEGEQTIARLLELVDSGAFAVSGLQHEPGIAFRNAGELVVNQPRPPIENLDLLPLPARDLIDMDRYADMWRETKGYSSITISTSRGCPFACEWCRDSVHGARYRQRSATSVAAEVRHLRDNFDLDRLRVVDDVDAIDRSWFDSWQNEAEAIDAVVPFGALNDLARHDIPMLDVRDSL